MIGKIITSKIGIGLICALVIGLIFSSLMLKNANLKQEILEKDVTLVKQKSDIEFLSNNIATLRKNVSELTKINESNEKLISQLTADAVQSKIAIDDLLKKNKQRTEQTQNLQNQIEQLKKNPSNDGSVSPVLRETIRSIQTNS